MSKTIGLAVMAMTGLIALGLTAASASAENAWQACGAKYRAAKANNTLPAGQSWNQFLAQCRATLPATPGDAASPAHAARPGHAPAAAASGSAAPLAGSTSPPASRPARPPSPGMVAAHERQRRCAAQWHADKAAGRVAAGMEWRQYWHECNLRLKAG